MKKLYLALAILIVILQVRLLSSEGGLGELFSLQEQLKTLESSLEEQRLINAKLAEEVKSLQSNPLSIETLARQNLGMVKKDEVFIKVIELKPGDVSTKTKLSVNNQVEAKSSDSGSSE
ncbi:hypothetical protein JCM30760_13400 [Thiomicrorhabdus hydrogeniphila]